MNFQKILMSTLVCINKYYEHFFVTTKERPSAQ